MNKKWLKEEEKILIQLRNLGETISIISKKLKRTEGSVEIKLRRLGMTKNNEWSDFEINRAIILINEGKNFKEIGRLINKSHVAVTSKMRRLGYKSPFNPNNPKNSHMGQTKYIDYDWKLLQEKYDSGLSQREICDIFNISSTSIYWAVKNSKFVSRTRSSAAKLCNEKYNKSKLRGIKRYRQLCEFNFSLNEYPNEFDFTLIEKYGWYRAKNRGNIPNGVNRDHMYSVKDGFINKINPKIISHPANCKLLLHKDNIKKKDNSSITLNELLKKIEIWNKKYNINWDVSSLPDKQ